MFGGKCGYICLICVLRVACNLGSCVDNKSIDICRTLNILHFRMAQIL